MCPRGCLTIVCLRVTFPHLYRITAKKLILSLVANANLIKIHL